MPPVCLRCGRPHWRNQPCAAGRPRPRAPVARPATAPRIPPPGYLRGLCGYTPTQGRFKGLPCTRPPHPSQSWQHDYTPVALPADDPEVAALLRSIDSSPAVAAFRQEAAAAEDARRRAAEQERRNAEAIRARRRPAPPPSPPSPPPSPPSPPGDDAETRFALLELDLEPIAAAAEPASPRAPDDSAVRFSLLELD